MKTTLTLIAAALLLTTSVAFAAEPAGAPPAGAPPAQEGGEKAGGERQRKWDSMTEEQKKEKFAEVKQRVLAKIEKHKDCVQKAADFETMKACRPKHGEGRRGGGGWGKRGEGKGGDSDGSPE